MVWESTAEADSAAVARATNIVAELRLKVVVKEER
jgi:hypothetical protein